MIPDATYWIRHLALQPHPEGGCFRETYRAEGTLAGHALPPRFKGSRAYSTAIYFLLQSQDSSRFHRIKSDELWHYYTGSSLTIHVLNPAGGYAAIRLGPHPEHGEVFQASIKAGCWFGATVNEPSSYALVGCTVAPGFDFSDFELAERGSLLTHYPQQADLIRRLT